MGHNLEIILVAAFIIAIYFMRHWFTRIYFVNYKYRKLVGCVSTLLLFVIVFRKRTISDMEHRSYIWLAVVSILFITQMYITLKEVIKLRQDKS